MAWLCLAIIPSEGKVGLRNELRVRLCSYGYDEFGRLKTMNIGSGTTVYSYGYDRYGNRWQQSATGSGSGPQLDRKSVV